MKRHDPDNVNLGLGLVSQVDNGHGTVVEARRDSETAYDPKR